jgi:hypothetical protein
MTHNDKIKDEAQKKKPLTLANQRLDTCSYGLVVVGGFEPPTSAL